MAARWKKWRVNSNRQGFPKARRIGRQANAALSASDQRIEATLIDSCAAPMWAWYSLVSFALFTE